MWVSSMTLEYANYILWAPKEVRIFVDHLYTQADTWIFWWSYTPGTIHGHHCSSQYHSLETLFIPILFTKITIHSNTINVNTDTIQYHIGIGFFLFSKFLPMKVR